jgi:hypothetical protein
LKRLSPSEIPLNELEIGSEIGSGRSGRVCVGKWKNYNAIFQVSPRNFFATSIYSTNKVTFSIG